MRKNKIQISSIIVLSIVLILIGLYFTFFNNIIILTNSKIEKQISNKIGHDVTILKNENNKLYKIVLFEANDNLGIATYKFNIFSKSWGSDYIFSYKSTENTDTSKSDLKYLFKGNDSCTYAILKYGKNSNEFIIYGNNSNKSLSSINLKSPEDNIINLGGENIFFIDRIIDNDAPIEIKINFGENSIKIY